MSMDEGRQYCVVTVYVIRPGAMITHVYGPKTRTEAITLRRKLMNDNADQVYAGQLHVSANRILDIEAGRPAC